MPNLHKKISSRKPKSKLTEAEVLVERMLKEALIKQLYAKSPLVEMMKGFDESWTTIPCGRAVVNSAWRRGL